MPDKHVFLAAAMSLVALSPILDGQSLSATRDVAAATAPQSSRVRLSTGVELQVVQRGPPDGEPVLFLHGFTDSWFSFSRMLDRLPSRVRAIVPTQRGHGDSGKPDCCYRVADFASDAVALLDALRIDGATVVGHSMGSFIAQRVAASHPSRVKQLVLVGSGVTVRTPPVLEFAEAVKALRDPVSVEFIRDFQKSTLHRAVPDPFFATVIRESQKVPARVWRDVIAGLIAEEGRTQLDRITARTLVVWGDKDAMWTRSDQDGLVQAIRGAHLVTYTGTGHSPQWEEPERVVADLREFMSLNAVPAGASSPEQVRHQSHAHANHHDGAVTLLDGLGDWQHPITTSSAEAQRFFNQGLRLTYAFNHEEAVRSFERAAALDPSCAMCYWGLAYALGPNINMPMSADAEGRACRSDRLGAPAERPHYAARARAHRRDGEALRETGRRGARSARRRVCVGHARAWPRSLAAMLMRRCSSPTRCST